MQIKGLLEMMFDKLASWIDELILDMEVSHHHICQVPKANLLLASTHAPLLGRHVPAGISCWQSNLSCTLRPDLELTPRVLGHAERGGCQRWQRNPASHAARNAPKHISRV